MPAQSSLRAVAADRAGITEVGHRPRRSQETSPSRSLPSCGGSDLGNAGAGAQGGQAGEVAGAVLARRGGLGVHQLGWVVDVSQAHEVAPLVLEDRTDHLIPVGAGEGVGDVWDLGGVDVGDEHRRPAVAVALRLVGLALGEGPSALAPSSMKRRPVAALTRAMACAISSRAPVGAASGRVT